MGLRNWIIQRSPATTGEPAPDATASGTGGARTPADEPDPTPSDATLTSVPPPEGEATAILRPRPGEPEPSPQGDPLADRPQHAAAPAEPATAPAEPVPQGDPLAGGRRHAAPPSSADRPPAQGAAEQADATEPAAPAPSAPRRLGFRERGRLRRRLRFLREVRELGFRDLGGLVFDQHRFRRPGEQLVEGKVAAIDAVDRELRAIEDVLDCRAPFDELFIPGVSACVRCGALHGTEARFCPNCGLAFGGPRTLAGVGGEPGAAFHGPPGQPPAGPYGPAAISPGSPDTNGTTGHPATQQFPTPPR